MIITKSEFSVSSPNIQLCPKDTKPEYAFIGRSNVGKSSLINMLCNHKNLAKTSATPGKTLLINHFIINNEWYLVGSEMCIRDSDNVLHPAARAARKRVCADRHQTRAAGYRHRLYQLARAEQHTVLDSVHKGR